MMVGGYSQPKPADDDIKAVVEDDIVKAAVTEQLGSAVDSIEVQEYQTQVVAGLNYKIKATVNGEKIVTITVFKPLPHTASPLQVKSVEAH